MAGALSPVARSHGLENRGVRTGPIHYYTHFQRFASRPCNLGVFPKASTGKRKGRLESSYLDFCVPLDQQTQNGVDFNYQGEIGLLLHGGGKEAIPGAQRIISHN